MLSNFKDSSKKIVSRIVGKIVLELRKKIFSFYEYPKIKQCYGNFRLNKNYNNQHIRGLSKESGTIRGVIVNIVKNLEQKINRVLLPGEYNIDKKYYSELFNINLDQIITTGIGEDTDSQWNFEEDPPEMGKFDLIVSQAMLEHLLNPYKHVFDLSQMLNPGGKLVLHTHVPGFNYHRFPIDCVRFYPDWFEEIAKRLDLSVYDRYIGDMRICYTLEKGYSSVESQTNHQN